MDLTFRTLGAWGPGKGANLEAAEVDTNFWNLAQEIVNLAANPALPVGIASISVSGTQMTITLTDGTTLGPFTLPVLTFRWRGEWTPSTPYAVLDVVTVTGTGIFMAQVDHTSGATFDMNQEISGTLVWYFLFGAVGAPIAPTAVDYLYVGNGDDPDGGIQFGDLTAQRLFANDPAGIIVINHSTNDPLPAPFVSNVMLRLAGQDGENVTNSFESWAAAGQIMFRRADNTRFAPAHLVAGDNIGTIAFRGYGATGYSASTIARMLCLALENFTDTAQGTYFRFDTTPAGSTAQQQQLLIGPGLQVGTPTPPAGGMLIGDLNATRVLVNGVAVGSGGGGFPEAPVDGTFYGRINTAWQRVLGLTGGTITGTLTIGAPGVPAGGLVTGDVDAVRVIISNNAVMPAALSVAPPRLWIVGGDGENFSLLLDGLAINAAIAFRRANGTAAAPSHVNTTDSLGQLAWRGYGATAYPSNPAARFSVTAVENFTDTAQGARFEFTANLIGSISLAQLATLGPGLLLGNTLPPSDYQLGDMVASRGFIRGAAGALILDRNPTVALPAWSFVVPLRLAAEDGAASNVTLESWGSNSLLIFRRADGTRAAPTALLINENLGGFLWRGYGATTYGNNIARIAAFSSEAWTDTAQGSRIEIMAAPIGGITTVTQMVIGPSGVQVGTPTPPAGGLLAGDLNANRVLVNGLPIASSGAGLSDAPVDGFSYGRLNAAWQRVLGLAGGAVTGNVTIAGYLTTGSSGLPSGGLAAGDQLGARFFVNQNPAAMPTPQAAATCLQINGADGAFIDAIAVDSHGAGNGVRLRRANGTAAAPSALLANDQLGLIGFNGYGATGYRNTVGGRIQCVASENWSDTTQGARLELGTTGNAGGSFVTHATIGPGLTVGAPTAPAGGMVTGDVNATRIMVNGVPVAGGAGASLPLAGGTIGGAAAPNPSGGALVVNGNPSVFLAPIAPGLGGARLVLQSADGEACNPVSCAIGANPNFNTLRANGTAAAPTAVVTGNNIGRFAAGGWNGTGWTYTKGSLQFVATENWSGTGNGCSFTISTTPNGATAAQDQATFGNGAGLVVGTPTPAAVPAFGDVNATRLLQNGAPVNTGYTFGFSVPSGVLTGSQVLGHHALGRNVTWPANFAGSFCGGTANATASTVLTIAKSTTGGTGTFTTIGTITIAAGSITPTFASTGGAAQSGNAGDVIRITGPATADATFANPYVTMVGA